MLIICPSCEKKFSDTLSRCPHCGELMSKYKTCPECHNLILSSSSTCSYCGYNILKAERQAEQERKSRNCKDCHYYDTYYNSNCSYYGDKLFKSPPSAANCPHYSYSDRAHETNHGCYLTTACVEYYGKSDDCYELQTLRNFRDNILRKTPEGQALCEDYYKLAPTIVKRLHELNDEGNYKYIYSQIMDCIKCIESKDYNQAIKTYKEMCLKMQKL